ncbi:putative isoprenylcysteine alpha-carbonyl methylesterase ICMEL1 [Drosera capensis]
MKMPSSSQSPILPITNPSSIKTNTPPSSSVPPTMKNSQLGVSGTRFLVSSSSSSGFEKTPLLSGENVDRGLGFQMKKPQRRRAGCEDESLLVSVSDGGDDGGGGGTVGESVEQVAAETWLVTRLCLTLLRYLGVGYRWITRFLALGCYAMLLMPGFIQVGYYYFFSSQIRRSIVYGDLPRNRLDLYLPKDTNRKKPVVAFVTGGAWIIGYKAWGCLLGQQLSERGIIVACIDYRNFPQGTISDMVEDASRGISFVCNSITEYGGDPDRVYLMGQSAGAHIAACALVQQAISESRGESVSWRASQLKAYFGLSGGYNLSNLVNHFHSRGLFRSLFLSIMKGEYSLAQYSPEIMVQDPQNANAIPLLPHIVLFHGVADYSIPSDSSKSFAETLKRLGAKAEVILYEGKTHTDLFLQDPMRGGKDKMFEDLLGIIHADDEEALAKDAVALPRKRMINPEKLNKRGDPIDRNKQSIPELVILIVTSQPPQNLNLQHVDWVQWRLCEGGRGRGERGKKKRKKRIWEMERRDDEKVRQGGGGGWVGGGGGGLWWQGGCRGERMRGWKWWGERKR